MTYTENASFDNQIKTGSNSDAGCRTEAGKHCLNEIMPIAADKTKPWEAGRPDIESGLFDENAPISHFDKISDGVYRSGRPNGKDGVIAAVEKVWGDEQFDPAHARQTAIVELRGPSKGKYYQPGEDEIHREEAYSAELGIAHVRFPMQTHDRPDPTFIQSVLDYVDQQNADGKKVLIHCYHGTDRTGTIAASYQLTHDPELIQLVKNNPDAAYERGIKSMKDNGFSPKMFPELAQGLNEFVEYKHAQLTGQSDRANANEVASARYLEIPSLWQKTA
jgi:hypothetical protein